MISQEVHAKLADCRQRMSAALKAGDRARFHELGAMHRAILDGARKAVS